MSRARRLVGVGDMVGEIARQMEEYARDVAEDMKVDAKAVAKEAVKELKSTSPVGKGDRKGHYNKGWTYSVDKESAHAIGITVHNSKKYRLTHLLEKGHANRGGGRTKAIKHIAPVEEQVVREYEKRLKERLSR